MIVKCQTCSADYDDEFRSTQCPHPTFLANDGRNNHQHHPKAYLSTDPTTDPTTDRAYKAPLFMLALAALLMLGTKADARIGGFDRRGCDYRSVLYRCERLCAQGQQ